MTRDTTPRVVALCGSLRDESRTRIALEEVLAASRAAGATTELVDLRAYAVPSLYAEPDGSGGADWFGGSDPDALRETVEHADAVLLGTPNYHGSYSGALKDALDHCGRDEFAGTTVGLLETAGGAYPGSAIDHLRTVSRTLRAWTLPTEVAIPNARETVTEDGIDDAELADRARRLGRNLADYAGVSSYPETVDRRPSAIGERDAD